MQNFSESERKRGVAMFLVVVAGIGLMALSVVTLDMSLVSGTAGRVQREAFDARQIAESGVAQAMARIKEAGFLAPFSGASAPADWVGFSGGDYLYYTNYDTTTGIGVVRSWGRIAVEASPSATTLPPDDPSFDGSGWMVQGVEITFKSTKYIPTSPLYFGNGGIEKPVGGFAWTGSSDPADPSTWGTVPVGSHSSYQASTVPFTSSALDHPIDHLYGGGPPAPSPGLPHPYQMWGSQNTIGQFNIEAWFANSAGVGNDPTITSTPPPTSAYYDVADNTSPDYPYPVDPSVPDVQTFAWDLWNRYGTDPSSTLLTAGSHAGTYGDLASPSVTFVTGGFQVDAGQNFKGAGILVIRDDFDPNVGTNNTPANRAMMRIDGTFEWTGLVIIAGWAPAIDVRPGGDSTIVGALFGEDSVQSGGEISLDSATINLYVQDDFRVLYSNSLFGPGGLIHDFLPGVRKEVVGVRDL